MKYLITGGAGFIGKHLTELLIKWGHEVTAIDNFENSTYDDINKFTIHSNYRFIEHDITRETYILNNLVMFSDVVIHLAATVGVANAVNNPGNMMQSNLKGMINVLDAVYSHKKKLMIASSSEVYGWSPKTPFKETDELVIPDPNHSRFNYALSKIVEEYYAFALHKKNYFPLIIFRIFNSTGEGQNNNHNLVLPNFINQALSGDPITVYGTGFQTRCFCYVKETCEAIYKLSLINLYKGKIFNIGSDVPVSMLDLAFLVQEKSKTNSSVEVVPYDFVFKDGFSDMQQRIPDLYEIKKAIGWKAKTSIDEIVEKFIDYELAKRQSKNLNKQTSSN